MSLSNDYSRPKNGSVFKVIGVGRISTEHQDEKSLVDQEAYFRNYLDREIGDSNYELEVIASQGSGQILDRAEFISLCEKVDPRAYDIVIAEDLGRISRRVHAIIFCEEAEDSGTRVIAINDHVDTAADNWKYSSIFASFKNESFCKDTSSRIKRSLRNRFLQGEIFQCEIFGYIKPHVKATDSEVYKQPEAEPVYDHWFTMLEEGASFRMVADWLNEQGVSTGKYTRSDRWDGPMVGRVTFNEILKGVRVRNKRISYLHNKTGRSRCKKAPPGHQLSRVVPHLAFIEQERYDRVIRLLEARNRKYKRSESERNDPRAGIPKRATRFPGQLCRCGVCGRLYVFGGHGKKDRLMCSGVRDHTCWNAMTIPADEVAVTVSEQVREFIENMEGFDASELQEYELQRESFAAKTDGELKGLKDKLASVKKMLSNQVQAIDKMGVSQAIAKRIAELEAHAMKLKDCIDEKESDLERKPGLPSLEKIQSIAKNILTELALDSHEFSKLMREAITEMYVLPYQLVDGGHIQPRIIYKVALASLLPDKHPDLPLMRFEGCVNLVKWPVRAKIREDAVALTARGLKQYEIATELAVTKTEVGNAMSLNRAMIARGIEDPWVPVTSVEHAKKSFKSVRHSSFKFKPLDGFESTKHPSD